MYQIMIVDDEAIMQDSLQKYISEQLPEYQISGIYSNALDAFEAFKRSPSDIVLIDIHMPEMDGLEFINQLNQLKTYYVPIIISSYGEFSYAKTAMELGVIHYLLKPVNYQELRQAIESAAAKVEQRRLTSAPKALLQDAQEIYFIDLFSGALSDSEKSFHQFTHLNFPFSYHESVGILLRINLKQTKSWEYGQESLHIALCNLIRMLYSPIFFLPLFYTKTYCDILLFHSDCHTWDFEELCKESLHILKSEILTEILISFDSLEDLYHKNYRNTLPLLDLTKVSEIEERDSASETATANAAIIASAITYMKEHYMDDLTREDIAGKVYMSGAHFSRIFKQETGTTYQNYLLELRMEKAIELLQTNQKIRDIAKKVGYSSLNRFIINFRHYTSYTPSEYRRNVLKIM